MDGFEIFVVSVDRQKLVVRRPVGRLLIVHDTKTSGIIEQNKNLNEGAEPVLVAIIGKRLRHPPPSPPLFLGSRSSQSENTGLGSEDCVFKHSKKYYKYLSAGKQKTNKMGAIWGSVHKTQTDRQGPSVVPSPSNLLYSVQQRSTLQICILYSCCSRNQRCMYISVHQCIPSEYIEYILYSGCGRDQQGAVRGFWTVSPDKMAIWAQYEGIWAQYERNMSAIWAWAQYEESVHKTQTGGPPSLFCTVVVTKINV